eukprot:CAMPEP_0197518526 /NCGR_PEP_ID=MMETSP1318-20131121/3730_1 /TAXON_ID=552666 /ORGANISM="Partenskyella glossopodia, Strain RCC365" /LENGTH=319 /DNA_ID=CAMNT_0043068935 /DNA_START=282 /DNA_END=1241 /DNA_ORIENTATION=+
MRRMSLSSLLLASTAAAACLPGIQPRARMEQRGNVAGVRHGSVRKLGSRFSFVGKPRVGLQCRGTVSPGDLVLVTGSTGGVGQLVVANLVQKGYRVRAVTRSAEKGRELFGEADNLEIVEADQRYAETLSSIMDGVDGVVSCSGTTAFPSKRWDGNNGPQMTDQVGLQNLIDSAKTKGQDLKRFVLVSSTGVVRRKQFPFAIMNAFGVLDYKKESEEYLESSGIPYTILRPGRLTDGPYTSYDLNTLLKATSGSRKNIEMNAEDVLNGEMSRVTLAEAVVQAMQLDCTEGGVLSMMSREGEGPGSDTSEWEKRYKNTLA